MPGRIAPTAYDRFQEGLAIPPTKLFRPGDLNREFPHHAMSAPMPPNFHQLRDTAVFDQICLSS